ncbi:hypothetical protein AB6A40_007891 [Gnathostoma spinigerum]|uniref:Uncharacterized protein n=1 Tax=Gnathostoma spinigerum TaxID=75299 RepID=A0ABD6EWY5_9BILA
MSLRLSFTVLLPNTDPITSAMRKSCFILLLLIVVVSYAEREVCSEACNKEYKNEKDLEECEAGCRLAVIYQFSLTGSVDVLDKCYEGCNKSYTENASACVYGCEHQPAVHHGSVEFMISNNEPTFGVVKDAMRKMFRGMSNMFSYFGGSMMNSKSSEVHDYSTEEEIIDNLHREMQRKMELFNEHMHNMIRGMQSDSESSEETEHQNMMGHWDRPNGHFVNAFFAQHLGATNAMKIPHKEEFENSFRRDTGNVRPGIFVYETVV